MNRLIENIKGYIENKPYDAGAYADLVSAYDNGIKGGDETLHAENKLLRPVLQCYATDVRERRDEQ